MRRASKVDLSQHDIVLGLRKCGYRVEVIGRPVDLMVTRHGPYWQLLELKTPTKTGKIRQRKDQAKQDDFIRETGTPRITTLEQALEALKDL